MAGISIKVDGVSAPISVESGYVAIRESIDFFVPSGTLVFKDRMSGFVSHYPFMQDTRVDVSLDDNNSVSTYGFYAFSSRKDQTLQGVESYQFSLDLLSNYALPLLTDSEYHSLRCSPSDYIRYVADRCGLRSEVESTRDIRSWVNPNWKFAQMVRYVAQRSVASSGSAGFLYFVRPDGTLVFKSADKLFDEEDVVNLTAGSYTILVDGVEETLTNKQITIKDNHFANVVLGSNNMNISVYDYKKGQYVVEQIDHQKYIRKRGAIKGISVEMSNIGKSKHVGSWFSDENDFPADATRYVYNKVLRQLESTQLQIIVPLDNKIRLGGVVNLSVPANMELFSGGVNLNYSGRYLIKSITTVGHGDFMKKLVLVRPGISLPLERKVNYF